MNKIMFIAASLLLAAAVGCANVPEEQALEEYNTRTAALVEDFNSQVAALQADSALSAEEMTAKMQEAYDAVSAELVSDGLEMIRKYPSGTLAVTVLQNIANVMEENQLTEALGMLEGAALEDEYVKSLVALNDAKQATAEGKMFTDFTVVQDPADSLGSKVSLSDFVGKGKYVLVDFWVRRAQHRRMGRPRRHQGFRQGAWSRMEPDHQRPAGSHRPLWHRGHSPHHPFRP